MDGSERNGPPEAAAEADRCKKGGIGSVKEFDLAKRLAENINRVFVGKADAVEKLLICLFSGGHVLLEDVPGVGKTTLAALLARSMEYEYRPGAVMNQVLLADEINRTSPKTQASLLEAMAEGQVTVDGQVHELPRPFLVIATQNPVEFLGTYPLPEAQMDRFMMRISIGYPEREQEILMASMMLEGRTPDTAEAVCRAEEVLEIQDRVRAVAVKESLLGYIEDMITLTRQEPRFVLGASPRALLALVRASQARAFLQGRDFVKPDDVKAVAMPVLLHRLVLSPEARMQKADAEAVLKSLILKVKVPV